MLFRGTFVFCPKLGELTIRHSYLLGVDSRGYVYHFESADSSGSKALLQTAAPEEPISLPSGDFLLPAFCDLHLHAPQFLYQGNGLDLPLMQWLDEYAFKAEERLDADQALARTVYTRLANRLIQNGTGTVMLFGTLKMDTNLILAETMQQAGIRGFVGKLSMDMSSRPTYVEASTKASVEAATSFVEQCNRMMQSLPSHLQLITPVITPRFVPTCSDELLLGLGHLAKEKAIPVQSHLAEAHDQVEWVRRERGVDDLEVFQRSGLLTPTTVQAHCTFLESSSFKVLHECGTSIAHCPLSNAYFSTEPFKLREALRKGVHVGLGTDVAGGYSIDIMNAMRQAVVVSRMRQGQNTAEGHGKLAIDWKEALYLATRGGAIALGLAIGTFEVGAPFDAQQIKLFDNEGSIGRGNLDFFDLEQGNEITESMVEKWWCLGDDKNRVSVWVQGRKLASI